jgi:hypothetical protein
MRFGLLFALVLAAGCRSTATEFISEQEGYRVYSGYVIQLTNLENPKVVQLKDGKAFHVTAPGSSLVLEGGRKRRTSFELVPGDIFVQSRPFSFLLKAPRSKAQPTPESRP